MEVASTPVPVQPPLAPVPTVTTAKKGGMGSKIVVVVVVAFLLLAGTTVFAYVANVNIPVISDIASAVEKIVVNEKQATRMFAEGLAKSLDATMDRSKPLNGSNNFDINIVLESVNRKNSAGNVKVTVTGTAGTKQVESKNETGIDLNMNIESAGVTLGGKMEGRFFLDLANPNNSQIFLRVKDLPAMLAEGFGLGDYINKWIGLNFADFGEATGLDVGQVTEIANNTQQRDAMRKLLTGDEFVNLIKRADDRVFGGIRTSCFTMPLTGKDLDKVLGMGLSSANTTVEFLMCVDRSNMNPYFVEVSSKMSDSDTYGSFVISVTIKDYGANINVEKPTADVDALELLNSLYTPTIDDSTDVPEDENQTEDTTDPNTLDDMTLPADGNYDDIPIEELPYY